MSNVVILDNVEHHDVKIRPERGDLYGDNINQALVFPNEFRDLQREYPILFRKDADGRFHAVALLGLDRDENAFLDGNTWNARYIPVIQARGPFSIVMVQSGEDGQPEAKVQLDLNHPAVNREEGFSLFKTQGGNSPYLEHMINILRTAHDGVALNKPFFDALEEHELIEPITLEVSVSDARQYSVPNVYSVSEEKLQKLSAETLEKLHKSGILKVCYWALSSLDNISALVDRKNRVS